MIKQLPPIDFHCSYANLGTKFGSHVEPNPISDPKYIALNQALAKSLNLNIDFLQSENGLLMLAGNQFPSYLNPFAQVYAGHQFAHWNPRLGDGRAVLLGEVLDNKQDRFDIQLKGSGQTPYSRGGDGRAPLGAVLREYLVSEAMYALGVPTTRSLAAVISSDAIYREQPQSLAVLTRVAKSHIRVGTFQYFASIGDYQSIKTLADYAIKRHDLKITSSNNPYIAWLKTLIKRQAKLIAQWQSFGFIHGVMNTDNMLISGETIDFGPCAFMETYHPATVFSSIDKNARYAYDQQPTIGKWNLTRLAECFLPLFSDKSDEAVDIAKAQLAIFDMEFSGHYQTLMQRKIGINKPNADGMELVNRLLDILVTEQLDFSLWFRMLGEHLSNESFKTNSALLSAYPLPDALHAWHNDWLSYLDGSQKSAKKLMSQTNPIFFPRNHQVEKAIYEAQSIGDFSLFHRLLRLYQMPYRFDNNHIEYTRPATEEEKVTQTFCGT